MTMIKGMKTNAVPKQNQMIHHKSKMLKVTPEISYEKVIN